MPSAPRFPDGFLWGAATSAYQIEGSPLADGAGASIWHRFSHTPGQVRNNDTADVACDHYRRSAGDVALMREIGLTSYRFSIAWGRVLPSGCGARNGRGLDFYSRLVDDLLAAGIVPNATLFHWDLPAALDDRGGWLNRDIASWFADYADVMFRALGDRVPMWSTLNEPWVVADGGYLYGVNAPGHRNVYEAPLATHHLLMAHGAAVQAYRAVGQAGQIGLVVNLEPKYAATPLDADVRAAARSDAYMNRQYLDPVFFGRYPEEMHEIYGAAWPAFGDLASDDMALIAQPVDFIGVNYYTRGVMRHDADAWPVHASPIRTPHATYTETGWEVHAESLRRVLVWVTERYGAPALYITENGAAFYDPPKAVEGRVDDPLRVQYFREHLRACLAAVECGVDLRGYYAWSLMDNFEWASGYAKRFGLIHVDYETQERTLKASAHFYRGVIESQGAVLGSVG